MHGIIKSAERRALERSSAPSLVFRKSHPSTSLPAMFLLTEFKSPPFYSWPFILGSTTRYTNQHAPNKIQHMHMPTSLPRGAASRPRCCRVSEPFSTFWWVSKCQLRLLTQHHVGLRLFSTVWGPDVERENIRQIYLQNGRSQKAVGQDLGRETSATGPRKTLIPITCVSPRRRYTKRFFFQLYETSMLLNFFFYEALVSA